MNTKQAIWEVKTADNKHILHFHKFKRRGSTKQRYSLLRGQCQFKALIFFLSLLT